VLLFTLIVFLPSTLMTSAPLQSRTDCLNLSGGVSQSKVEKQW